MKFKIEKVANMIFITADQDIIFKAWDITEFTERKLQNAIKHTWISFSCHCF